MVEPFYAAATRSRNWCFDHRLLRAHDLGRPTICVGNITTGGTGKTPVVLWLANQLRDAGYSPRDIAARLRLNTTGTQRRTTTARPKLEPTAGSDALRRAGSCGGNPSGSSEHLRDRLGGNIPVRAHPSRVESAKALLREDPSIDIFILDDGFQHRKARRDFDLVLINATEPFGHGHVLPRGLLREPLVGLRRASAFLITRSSQADCSSIQATLARINPNAPIFRSDHIHSEIWMPATKQRLSISQLAGGKIFVFAGIGDPESFARQLASAGCSVVGHRWFADHHPYSTADLDGLANAAKQAGAAQLLTTQKDWVKISPIYAALSDVSIGVVELAIAISDAEKQALLDQIVKSLPHLPVSPPAASVRL